MLYTHTHIYATTTCIHYTMSDFLYLRRIECPTRHTNRGDDGNPTLTDYINQSATSSVSDLPPSNWCLSQALHY